MVEGTRLESVRTLKRTAGSNPALSAKRGLYEHKLKCVRTFSLYINVSVCECICQNFAVVL